MSPSYKNFGDLRQNNCSRTSATSLAETLYLYHALSYPTLLKALTNGDQKPRYYYYKMKEF